LVLIVAIALCWIVPPRIYHYVHPDEIQPPSIYVPEVPTYEQHTPDLDHQHPPIRADTVNPV
jgi:hypothetical protein